MRFAARFRIQPVRNNQIDDARDSLCDGGAYHDVDPTCPQPAVPTLTDAQAAERRQFALKFQQVSGPVAAKR